MKYRPEIDGLRAIAVMSVVIYHADMTLGGYMLLSGGYIGVDVFFVISGYLIASIIINEMQKGRFSFLHFYERRARRILPALFLVMAVSFPFAWKFMLPDALEDFAGSGLSALFFGSNFWFWWEDSYTADISSLKPLLHTWSLSVEEQFYVLFPLLLVIFWKIGQRFLNALFISGIIASLLYAQTSSSNSPDAAFYLLPARGWELLAGAVLANFESNQGRERDYPFASYYPALGLLLMLGTMVMFDENTQHPSVITALPVAGTMLILWFSKKGELVGDLLGNNFLTSIGLISYPLYLWHFPIFAFGHINSENMDWADKITIVLVSLVLAYLTFQFVEKYTRNKMQIDLRVFSILIGSAFFGLVIANTFVFYSNGYPSRLGPIATIIEKSKTVQVMQDGKKCHDRSIEKHCIFEKKDAKLDVWLVGDSHAEVLGNEVYQFSKENNFGYRQITLGGCLHFENVTRKLKKGDYCGDQAVRSHAFQELVRADKRKKIIVWSARIVAQFMGEFDNQEGGIEKWPQPFSPLIPVDRTRSSTISSLIQQSIKEWLHLGNIVVLVYPVPEVGWDVAKRVKLSIEDKNIRTVFGANRAFSKLDISTNYALFDERSKIAIDILDGIQHKNLHRVYPDRKFCSRKTMRCKTHDDEVLFYRDNNHVSPYGAKLIIDEMKKLLGRSMPLES